MGLPTLEDKRERGNLITINTVMNGLEEVDRKDQLLKGEREYGYLRGHVKNRKKECT